MKTTLFVVGIIVLMGVAVLGFARITNDESVAVTASPAGATFNTARVAAININPIDITSTSSSMLNSDANDRIVTDAFVTCSGLVTTMSGMSGAVADFRWLAATSSTAAPIPAITNVFAAMNMAVATSTSDGYAATTTYTSPFSRRWNTGTYLVFQANATSSAATCQAGVHYLST